MNMFNYYITTHFITNNKDYNSCRNSHLVYQTYPYFLIVLIPIFIYQKKKKKNEHVYYVYFLLISSYGKNYTSRRAEFKYWINKTNYKSLSKLIDKY